MPISAIIGNQSRKRRNNSRESVSSWDIPTGNMNQYRLEIGHQLTRSGRTSFSSADYECSYPLLRNVQLQGVELARGCIQESDVIKLRSSVYNLIPQKDWCEWTNRNVYHAHLFITQNETIEGRLAVPIAVMEKILEALQLSSTYKEAVALFFKCTETR